MNGFTKLKDIRFPDTKANILLRGGMISREDLMNVKNSMITMCDVHFGIAKRINDVTSLEVRYLNEWRSVMCGDTITLQSIYALTPSDEDVEKYKNIILAEKVEIPSAQKIESADEGTVKFLRDLLENPIDFGTSIMVDSVTHVEVKDEETKSHEDEIVEEDIHEEVEVVETTSDHDPGDDYDANEMPEESSVEDASKIDVSNAEHTTTSTSTASTTINSQGNVRRQVNINAHGKHRRR